MRPLSRRRRRRGGGAAGGLGRRYPFRADQAVQAADWELYISQISKEILGEQSPKTLYMVRQRLYELLVNCIPAELVLKVSSLAPSAAAPRSARWLLAGCRRRRAAPDGGGGGRSGSRRS